MNPATSLIIDREMSRYKQSFETWSRQVCAQRTPVDAFRAASHKPAAGALISSLRHLANSERMQAERSIERKLQAHVDALDPSDPHFATIMRLAQGHWPRLYNLLDQKRRKAMSTN